MPVKLNYRLSPDIHEDSELSSFFTHYFRFLQLALVSRRMTSFIHFLFPGKPLKLEQTIYGLYVFQFLSCKGFPPKFKSKFSISAEAIIDF